jgi:hypothetical protein
VSVPATFLFEFLTGQNGWQPTASKKKKKNKTKQNKTKILLSDDEVVRTVGVPCW